MSWRPIGETPKPRHADSLSHVQTGFHVSRLSGSLGARIDGLEIRADLDDDTFRTIIDLFARYHVLVFGDQTMTPDDHIRFAQRFGGISRHPGVKPVDGYPDIIEVIDPANPIASTWHQDQTFLEAPPLLSLLVARVLPEAGGDTLFANQERAFDALSGPFQRLVEGLRAVHQRSVSAYGHVASFEAEAVHPIAPRNPFTGRRALFVNRDYTVAIEGVTPDEGNTLLEFLERHGTRSEFTCRQHWLPGDVVVWNNRSLLHCVISDVEGPRMLHKITVRGEAPV